MDNAHFKVPLPREYYRQAVRGCKRKLTESERLEKLLPHAILQGYTRTAQWCLKNEANIKTAMATVRQLKSLSAPHQPGNITEHLTTPQQPPQQPPRNQQAISGHRLVQQRYQYNITGGDC